MGGGRENSVSMMEVIDIINEEMGSDWNNYTISDENRIGDHIWYISNLDKFKKDYPDWNITKNIREIVREMIS